MAKTAGNSVYDAAMVETAHAAVTRCEDGKRSDDQTQGTRNKMKAMLPELPRARRFGDQDAKIGFIGIGLTFGVILEAMDSLADRGIDTQYFQIRTLWPMLDETIEFINACDVVYVVDLNATAQLASLCVREGADTTRIRNLLHYDGTPIRSDAVVDFVVKDQDSGLNVEEVA